MRLSDNTLKGALTFRRGPLGSGGWSIGGTMCSEGTLYSYNDTFNAYRLDPGKKKHKMMFEVGVSEPKATHIFELTGGVCTLAANKASTGRVYAVHAFAVRRSNDRGDHWTGSTTVYLDDVLPNFDKGSNSAMRHQKPSSALDPANDDVLFIGSNVGLAVTTNGAESFTKVAGLPNPTGTDKKILVAFDPTGPVSGGRTQRLYCVVPGSGVYVSTNAGTVWTLIVGSPVGAETTNQSQSSGFLAVHPVTSTVYVSFGDALYRYKAGAWSQMSVAGASVACHPTEPKVWAASGGSSLSYSPDDGAAWPVSGRSPSRVAIDKPWLAATNEYYMSHGSLFFDPVGNRLLCLAGIGIWEWKNPTVFPDGNIVWNSVTDGIEQLCTQSMSTVYAPGTVDDGRLLYSCQDRGYFSIPRLDIDKDTPPKGHGPDYRNSLNHSGGMDYATGAPTEIVGTCLRAFSPNFPVQVSKASGTPGTYSDTPTNPMEDAFSGCIAAAGLGKYLLVPTNKRYAQYTLDGGATWNYVMILGRKVGGNHHAYYIKSVKAIADKRHPGTYYFYVFQWHNPDLGSADPDPGLAPGVFKSTDYGVNWVRVSTGYIDGPRDYWNSFFKQNILKEGHFFWTAGDEGGDHGGDGSLRASVDGCATWSAFDIHEVYDFAVGKAGPGETYERIYAYGRYNDVQGVYLIRNWNPVGNTYEVVLLAEYPCGHGDQPACMAADFNLFGRFYIGYAGSGFDICDYRHEIAIT